MRTPASDATGRELVTVRTFTSESEAGIAKSGLEAFGIECMLSRDDCGGQRSHLLLGAGIRLLIRLEDTEPAEQVLTSLASD